MDALAQQVISHRLNEAMQNGVGEGESLDSLRDDLYRLVIAATISNSETIVSASRSLGQTRENIYKLRKRLGLNVQCTKPTGIPDDWRERLERAKAAG